MIQDTLNESQVIDLLVTLGQQHLLEKLAHHEEVERLSFVQQVRELHNHKQINKINLNYPGGLREYVQRAKKLLHDSCDLVNPYEDYLPCVPQGEEVNFYNPEQISELESLGIKEINKTCFVLVAGGLGERLGYDGIKVGIPIELVTKQTFLQYYVHYILAFQDKHSLNNPLPFVIMTSDDTHDLTLNLLQQNQYFGMNESIINVNIQDQITLLKQEKIPAMIDNQARFQQLPNRLLLDTKPHGHGDIHTLLYMSGVADKWVKEGRQWMFIFQDTNPFALRALPSVLGVSKKRGFELNSIAIPRKLGEAVGAICELRHKDGSQITINVEYNQLEPLMKSIGGEITDEQGFSKFPGNINSLLFSLPEYNKVLQLTKGLISEFINPKYADSSRSVFKSATRLECMMQDYPKLLSADNKVGFTMINRNFCFTTLKNDLVTAAQKHQQNLPQECAGSCESDFYYLNSELLKLAGANIESRSDAQEHHFAGVGLKFGPKVVLHPSFGVTLDEIKSRIKGKLNVSLNSTLVLEGEIFLKDVEVDGILKLTGNGTFENISIKDKKYQQFREIDPQDSKIPPYLKIRGYSLNQ